MLRARPVFCCSSPKRRTRRKLSRRTSNVWRSPMIDAAASSEQFSRPKLCQTIRRSIDELQNKTNSCRVGFRMQPTREERAMDVVSPPDRYRVVTWQDPRELLRAAHELNGLELLHRIAGPAAAAAARRGSRRLRADVRLSGPRRLRLRAARGALQRARHRSRWDRHHHPRHRDELRRPLRARARRRVRDRRAEDELRPAGDPWRRLASCRRPRRPPGQPDRHGRRRSCSTRRARSTPRRARPR